MQVTAPIARRTLLGRTLLSRTLLSRTLQPTERVGVRFAG
jgi:hypothetical protein